MSNFNIFEVQKCSYPPRKNFIFFSSKIPFCSNIQPNFLQKFLIKPKKYTDHYPEKSSWNFGNFFFQKKKFSFFSQAKIDLNFLKNIFFSFFFGFDCSYPPREFLFFFSFFFVLISLFPLENFEKKTFFL